MKLPRTVEGRYATGLRSGESGRAGRGPLRAHRIRCATGRGNRCYPTSTSTSLTRVGPRPIYPRTEKAGRSRQLQDDALCHFVVVSNGPIAEVKATKQAIQQFLENKLHLTLSEEKTVITHERRLRLPGFPYPAQARQWPVGLASSTDGQSQGASDTEAQRPDFQNWTWMEVHPVEDPERYRAGLAE